VPAKPAPLSIGMYYPDAGDPQVPAQVAVVTPTVLRPHVARALDSIYAQQGVGRIQVLLGVDKALDSPEHLDAALARRPDNVSAVVLQMPFSTGKRHGGVHPSLDGGGLRSTLSYMANSRHVAYLDDDNAWEPDHLSSLLEVVKNRYWAHSLRMLIDEETGEELGVDVWDSVGVNRGRFAEQGGMVDPNCLLIDKVAAGRPLGRWCEGPGWEADRTLFDGIKDLPHGRVDRPTVRYGIRRVNVLHDYIRGVKTI
jgi:hypothetical protein